MSAEANKATVLAGIASGGFVLPESLAEGFELSFNCDPRFSSGAAKGPLSAAQLLAAVGAAKELIPDYRQTVTNVVAEGDFVVLEATASGSRKSNPEKRLNNRGIVIYEFKGGKILRIRGYEDTAHVHDFWEEEEGAFVE